MRAAGHEARDVRHVHHHDALRLVADLADALEVERARIGARAGEEDLRLHLQRLLLEGVVVDALGRAVHGVRHDVVELAGEVDGGAVRQVPALVERKGEDRVPGLDGGEVDGHVGGTAAVRLHVRVFGPEELAGALPRQLLGGVHWQAARVPALARIPLGVLVHQHAAGGETHGAGRGVFGGDEVDLRILLHHLRLDGGVDLGIVVREAGEVAQTPGALDLRAAAGMALGFVHRRGDERLQDLDGLRGIHLVGPRAEHVRAVVLARENGRGRVKAQRRAHVLEPIGGHRHAHARAAHEQAEVHLAARDLLRDGIGIVREVTRFRPRAAHVDELRVRKGRDDTLLQFEPAVVGADGNLHFPFPSCLKSQG